MQLTSRNDLETEKLIWTIKYFHHLPPRKGLTFKSTIIHKKHARKVWRFFLYPTSISDPKYMSAYFHKAYSTFDPMMYKCSVSVGSSNSNQVETFMFQCVDLQCACVGGIKCLRTDSIENLPKGSVTIQCEITELFHKSFFPYIVSDFENLSSDLMTLYKSRIHHDLTVRIQQFEFHLHTCVLYARCRRLSHVFGYESFSRIPNFVQISNISPHLFQQLITYLYSGKIYGTDLSLELFMCAHKLKLQSFKHLVYEKVQEYNTVTEIATETVTVTWNLKELQFREKDMIPFVQIFQVGCCMTHLAVRMGLSNNFEGEEYIDISFKVFLDTLNKPVSMLCVMTLFCNGKVSAYKKGNYSIEPNEEWHFPPFIKLSDIPISNGYYVPDMCLSAEVSLSDSCTAYDDLHTTTRLFTQNPPVVYPERLGTDMARLLSPKALSRFKKHDIYFKSVNNCYMPANKAIVWVRWPEIRNVLSNMDEPVPHFPLNLRTEEMKLLLNYIYTGSIPYLNFYLAEKLLRANSQINLPIYIVNKCRYLLYGRIG